MQHEGGTHFSSLVNYLVTAVLAVASFFTIGGCSLPAELFAPTPAPGANLPADVREELRNDASPGNPANLSTASPAEKMLNTVATGAAAGAAVSGTVATAAGPYGPVLILLSTALSAVASIASFLRDRLRAKSTQQEREKS